MFEILIGVAALAFMYRLTITAREVGKQTEDACTLVAEDRDKAAEKCASNDDNSS